MTYLAVDTFDFALRETIETTAFDAELSLSGAGGPSGLIRTAREQEERGTSSDAPLIVVWDPSRRNGGGDPFSYGLLRHLVTPQALASTEVLTAIVDSYSAGHGRIRGLVCDRAGETYRAVLEDAQARPSFEAAILNDLNRLDVDSHASARVIKALVSLTSVAGVGSPDGTLRWPVRARFGATDDRVWLELTCGATLSPEALLAELSRGYLASFKDRAKSRVPAMGWFFALRQVDGMFLRLETDYTEVLIACDRSPMGWVWNPSLHISVPARHAWRRARRYPVNWRGELNATERRIEADIVNLSSLGALVRVTGDTPTFRESEQVRLQLEVPLSESDREVVHLDGAIRYVDPAKSGVAIEFESEARDLGQTLERMQLAA